MSASSVGAVSDSLRHLRHASLAFAHFQLRSGLLDPATAGNAPCYLGPCVLLAAEFRRHPVTLLLQRTPAGGPSGVGSGAVCSLRALAKFTDVVPTRLLHSTPPDAAHSATTAASVSVLPAMRVLSLWRLVSEWPPVCERDHERSVCLLLLQTVHSLLDLSTRGQIQLEPSLSQLMAVQYTGVNNSSSSDSWTVAVLYTNCRSSETTGCLTLCQSALAVLLRVLGVGDAMERVQEGRGVSVPSRVASLNLFELLVILLQREQADTLLHVRTVLETVLWGPGDGEAEGSLQCWLDRRRAEVLATLVARGRLWSGQVDVADRLLVQFLAETDVTRLQEAAALLSI